VVVNIPAGLECFAAYIQSEMRNDWIKWHSDGDGYLLLQKNCCPYCAQGLDGVEDRVKLVAQKYDANSVKHLVNMVTVFKELAKDGLSTEASDFVKNVTTNAEGFGNEDAERLMGIKRQVDLLSQKLRTLQAMNFYTERDDPAKIKDKLNGLRLDSSKFVELKSAKVDEVVAVVNETIDSALASVDELQQEVEAQQKRIADEIKKYDTHINAFMELAGYPYRVSIVDLGNEEYKTLLSHVDLPGEEIHEPKSHLSYGERNAFALSLFVYDAIHSDPDLVVLDDPISSFDGNKKFALLKMMFWEQEWDTLSGKTVLMLTHDFCPVIDVTWTFSKDFPASPVAWYLKCVDGCVNEMEIKKNDVQSALDVNRRNMMQKGKDLLLRIVYYRKWLELKGERGCSAYELVSNVEHLREAPKLQINGELVDMPDDKIEKGTEEIKKRITDFDYGAAVARASDVTVLKALYDGAQCSFEKVLMFRYMVMAYKQRKGVEPVLDGIIRKYMNEPFHIENDYVYQLNPYKYDLIPDSEIRLFDAKVDDLLS
jgi:ABC-type dipeptide/oligopeptide/nickel transport system ATPase subunit